MRVIQPLLLMFLLASLHAASQEKFVEVTVSDTAWVKPNQFVYSISVNLLYANDGPDTSNNFTDYRKKQLYLKTQQRQLLDSVRIVLSKQGFFIMPVNIYYAYSTETEGTLNSVDVLTSTTDSLQILYNLVDNNINLVGRISSVAASTEEVYKGYLLQKLLSKARLKAASIGKLGRIKIGNILSVKEVPNENNYGGWTAYPPMSHLSTSMEPGWVESRVLRRYYSAGKTEVNGFYSIENTLVVRFAVQ